MQQALCYIISSSPCSIPAANHGWMDGLELLSAGRKNLRGELVVSTSLSRGRIHAKSNDPRRELEMDKEPESKRSRMGGGIGIGIALGIAIGVAIDNIAIGIAIGLAIGAGIGAAWDQQDKKKE